MRRWNFEDMQEFLRDCTHLVYYAHSRLRQRQHGKSLVDGSRTGGLFCHRGCSDCILFYSR